MPNPVVHWEIAAKDAAKLQNFYSKLFGWTVDSKNPMNYGMVDTGAKGGINGGIMTTPNQAPPYLTFYVAVDDLKAYLDKAVSLGAKPMVPPTPIPGHRIVRYVPRSREQSDRVVQELVNYEANTTLIEVSRSILDRTSVAAE